MVVLMEKMDHVRVKQMKMFRDAERTFWEDILDAVDDDGGIDNKYRLVSILILRFVAKFDEEWIARTFDIDIANVSRAISKGVHLLRSSDIEMLCRRAVATVAVPVETLEALIDGAKPESYSDLRVDTAVRAALDILDGVGRRADLIDAESGTESRSGLSGPRRSSERLWRATTDPIP